MGTVRLTDSYDERFGFQARGCFYCRYKSEPLLVAAAAAAVTVVLWAVVYNIIVAPQASALLYIAALFMDSAVFFCVGMGAVRVILGGKSFCTRRTTANFVSIWKRGRIKS